MRYWLFYQIQNFTATISGGGFAHLEENFLNCDPFELANSDVLA